jgi:hypothetical protein
VLEWLDEAVNSLFRWSFVAIAFVCIHVVLAGIGAPPAPYVTPSDPSQSFEWNVLGSRPDPLRAIDPKVIQSLRDKRDASKR